MTHHTLQVGGRLALPIKDGELKIQSEVRKMDLLVAVEAAREGREGGRELPMRQYVLGGEEKQQTVQWQAETCLERSTRSNENPIRSHPTPPHLIPRRPTPNPPYPAQTNPAQLAALCCLLAAPCCLLAAPCCLLAAPCCLLAAY